MQLSNTETYKILLNILKLKQIDIIDFLEKQKVELIINFE